MGGGSGSGEGRIIRLLSCASDVCGVAWSEIFSQTVPAVSSFAQVYTLLEGRGHTCMVGGAGGTELRDAKEGALQSSTGEPASSKRAVPVGVVAGDGLT